MDNGLIVFEHSSVHKRQAPTDHHCLHHQYFVAFVHCFQNSSNIACNTLHLEDEYDDDDVRQKEGESEESWKTCEGAQRGDINQPASRISPMVSSNACMSPSSSKLVTLPMAAPNLPASSRPRSPTTSRRVPRAPGTLPTTLARLARA